MNYHYDESIANTNLLIDKLRLINLSELDHAVQSINQVLDLRNSNGKKKFLSFTATPFVFSEKDYNQLDFQCKTLHKIIEKVVTCWYEGDDLLRDFFQIPDFFVPLIYKQHPHWQTYTRYDFILTLEKNIQVNEFNSASPGALATTGLLNSVTREYISKQLQDFRFFEQPLESPNFIVSVINELEKQANINPSTVAILYDDHYMLFELFEFANQMRAAGRDVVVGHVSECRYENKKLLLNDKEISTIMNNFFLRGKNLDLKEIGPWQTLKSDNKEHAYWPLCQAMIENTVLLMHGFAASLIIEDKRFFSILRSKKFSYLFSPEDKKIIENMIPQTLTQNCLQQDTHLRDEIVSNKDKYIYKLALSGAGLGIVLGEQVTKNEWYSLIKSNDFPYSIQEKITPCQFKVLYPTEIMLNHNLSYYSVFGELAGCHSRVSDHLIVTAQAKDRTAYCQPVLVGDSHV